MGIAVSDNGTGISPEFLPHVFDRFRQGDSSTKRKFGGLGLGLSIVKHLVELHGGTVAVQSDGEGAGSTFTVNLPIRAVNIQESDDDDANEARYPAKSERLSVRLDGLRVLVVDDETDARRLVAKVLEDAGASVTAAATVREALKSLEKKEWAPHVLISDLSMPEEDGFDLIRQVRSIGHTVHELPAVALTAFADKVICAAALLGDIKSMCPSRSITNDLIAVVASLAGRTGSAPPSMEAP